MSETSEFTPPTASLPDGDYAIVELLGHRTLIGRVTEIERFGTKFLQVEPLFQGELLGPVLHGGGSIYAFTPCTKEVAANRAPKHAWQLPSPVAASIAVPAGALPSPDDFDTLPHTTAGEFVDFDGEGE